MKQIPVNLEAIELVSDIGLGCHGHSICFFVESTIAAIVSSPDTIDASETGNVVP